MVFLFIFALIAFFCAAFVLYTRYRVYYYAWYINFPKPKYRYAVDKNVMVPMKDGTKLATDIYRPKSHRKFPVIVLRTPYNKSGSLHPYRPLAELFASQGYVVVVQDVRGKFASEGSFYPYAYEALDGHTTVTWAGEAPWSNGRVAILGISYLGSCAWLAARYKSPYLRTVVPMFTTQNTYSVWIDKGIPFLKGPIFWLGKYGGKKTNNRLSHADLVNALWELPVNNLDMAFVNHRIPFFRDYLEHLQPDSFWKEISSQHCSDTLNIPALIIGGWYDPFLNGTIEDFQCMVKAPLTSSNHHSRLVLGPWGHNPNQKFKGIHFGEKADFNPFITSMLEWFEVWLKENEPEAAPSKRIQYFVMGKNEWKEAEQWPPSNVAYEKYFLSMKKRKSHTQQGLLSAIQSQDVDQTHFIYNPLDPVLFRGTRLLDSQAWIEQTEQSEITDREDVLIYTSESLEKELTIAGTIKLILHVSSEAVDTDFCAKICDMHPNGKAYNLTPGFIRMRYRQSLMEPLLMEPQRIYRIEISFKPVANTFLKDHCIQLQITSSDFPVHDRNLNTGLSCETSIEIKETKQTIYTGGPYDSYLLIPVLNE